MQGTRSVQTAFRLRPELVTKLKNEARRRRISLNALVESILEAEVSPKIDVYESLHSQLADYVPDTNFKLDFLPLPKCNLEFTQGELEADPKLSFLVEKYGL